MKFLNNWDEELPMLCPPCWGSLLEDTPGPAPCHAPSVPLLCMPWAVCDEPFAQTEGCPTNYALLLMILMVCQVHLCSWYGTVSHNSGNLCCCLKGYLWPHYAAAPHS